jgi:hypothetical protein
MQITSLVRIERLIPLGVLAACVVALACGSEKANPPADTSPATAQVPAFSCRPLPHPITAAPDTAAPDTTASSTSLEGELTEPIEMMKSHPDSFCKLVRQAHWKGREHERKCKNDPGCASETAKAKILLEVIKDARKVDITKLPANGVLVARMINTGTLPEEPYDIPPGNGEYYLLWDELPNKHARERMVTLTFDQNGNPAVDIRTVLRGPHSCGHEQDVSHSADAEADFTGCSSRAASPDSLRVFAMSKSAWVSCSQGCCSTDFQPPFGDQLRTGAIPSTRKRSGS